MRASRFGAVLALVFAGCNFVVDGLHPRPSGPGADLATAVTDMAMSGTVADLASGGVPDLATPAPGDLAITGLLSCPIVRTADNLDVNLTIEGLTDWAHWGTTTATSYDHKSLGTNSPIGNFTNTVGNQINQQNSGYPVGFTWTDGVSPTTTATNTQTGIYAQGDGSGFRFTLPADTTVRTFKFYAGGQQSTAKVFAHLSDGSAPDCTAQTSQGPGDQGQQYERTVTVIYRALTAGATLRFEWTQVGNGGGQFVHMHSASLF
jgi:hypothetical protein